MAEERVYVPSSALDSFAFALYAEIIPEIGTRNPLLKVKLKLNKKKPQFSSVVFEVTHFIRGEEKYKTFEIETNKVYAQAALEQLKVYAGKAFDIPKEINVWEVKAPKKVNGQMTKERVTAGKLVVGRNEKGPFISVVHWNDKYPHIAFYPGTCDQMAVVNPAAGDVKRQYEYVAGSARGWATTVGGLLITEYSYGTNLIIEQLRRQQAQNGGYGSDENSGSGGGDKNIREGGYDHNNSTTEHYTSDGGEFNF